MSESQLPEILVVEDDIETANLLKLNLESAGYTAQAVHFGADALNYIKHIQVSLVILDLTLPDMSGLDVARKIQELELPWFVPILILTGRNTVEDELQGLAVGALAYLTKPCGFGDILVKIEELVGEPQITL